MGQRHLLLAPVAVALSIGATIWLVGTVIIDAVHDAVIGGRVRREAQITAALAEMWPPDD